MAEMQNRETGSATGGTGLRYLRKKSSYLGVIPFFLFAGIFLLYPTFSVVTGAFRSDDGKFNPGKVTELLNTVAVRNAFNNSLEISLKTAVLGSILGGLFAWALTTGKPGGIFYRFSVALSSVLAQFGGVMLTFAFLATFGFNGVVSSIAVKLAPNSFLAQSSWLYTINGLAVVYTFFQIPLMVLVFLPTIENMKPQWREASESLGGSAYEYWRRVGIPVLTPSFFGAMLLLFVNSFSAYATAATLINLSDFLTPLQIGNALSSEVGGANPQEAKALSMFMVIVVIIAMAIYAQIRRRVSRWESSR
jgi:putative spermidine/putrescine transport system permease protein